MSARQPTWTPTINRVDRVDLVIQVEVDLSAEGDAKKVSRKQAYLSVQSPSGSWMLRNVGRRLMVVNGQPLAQGQMAVLPHLSFVEVGGVRLLFMVSLEPLW